MRKLFSWMLCLAGKHQHFIYPTKWGRQLGYEPIKCLRCPICSTELQ